MDDLILSDQEGGTADIVPSSPTIMAADITLVWGSQPDRSEDERAAADRYLSQWPNGPQL